MFKYRQCFLHDDDDFFVLGHGHGILCTRLDRLVLLNNGGHFVLTSIVIHSHFGNEFTIVVILKLITSVTVGVHSIFGFVLRPY